MALLRKRSGETPAGLPAGPSRKRRAQALFVRLAGAAGIVGAGTAIAAILGSQEVDHWVTGLVVALVTLVLGFVLRRGVSAWIEAETAASAARRASGGDGER